MSKLVKCADCKKKVSINAENCPKCGAVLSKQHDFHVQKEKSLQKQIKEKEDLEKGKKALLWIISLVAMFFAYGISISSFFFALVMFVGAILILPQVKDFIVSKKSISRNILSWVGSIMIAVGFLFGGLSAQEHKNEYLANNPDAARELAEKEAQKAKEQAEKDRAYNTSKVMLISKCELAVKPTLKNPNSMDVDFNASQDGLIDGKPAVHMYYYAENSFGATPRAITTCKFDDDGNLLEVVNVQ